MSVLLHLAMGLDRGLQLAKVARNLLRSEIKRLGNVGKMFLQCHTANQQQQEPGVFFVFFWHTFKNNVTYCESRVMKAAILIR